jgi:hypothetical protein
MLGSRWAGDTVLWPPDLLPNPINNKEMTLVDFLTQARTIVNEPGFKITKLISLGRKIDSGYKPELVALSDFITGAQRMPNKEELAQLLPNLKEEGIDILLEACSSLEDQGLDIMDILSLTKN